MKRPRRCCGKTGVSWTRLHSTFFRRRPSPATSLMAYVKRRQAEAPRRGGRNPRGVKPPLGAQGEVARRKPCRRGSEPPSIASQQPLSQAFGLPAPLHRGAICALHSHPRRFPCFYPPSSPNTAEVEKNLSALQKFLNSISLTKWVTAAVLLAVCLLVTKLILKGQDKPLGSLQAR